MHVTKENVAGKGWEAPGKSWGDWSQKAHFKQIVSLIQFKKWISPFFLSIYNLTGILI